MFQLIIYQNARDAVDLEYQNIQSIIFSNYDNIQPYIDQYILNFIDTEYKYMRDLLIKSNASITKEMLDVFSLPSESRKDKDYINKVFRVMNTGYILPTQIEFKIKIMNH